MGGLRRPDHRHGGTFSLQPGELILIIVWAIRLTSCFLFSRFGANVHLGGKEYDAGITTEELLLIMANDEDKERAVSDESWALATGLLRLHDPGAAPIVRQFTKQADPANHNAKSNRLQKWLGFSVVDESHGTKYEAKILDAKGTLHHFAHHFPTEWGAAAAHGAFILNIVVTLMGD